MAHDLFQRKSSRGLVCLLILLGLYSIPTHAQNVGAPATNYDALISEGNQFFKDGKFKEGYQDAMSAAAQDPKRFEAFALGAFILQKQGEFSKAKEILDEAISRAPTNKRDALLLFQKKVQTDITAASAPEAASQGGGQGVVPEVEVLKKRLRAVTALLESYQIRIKRLETDNEDIKKALTEVAEVLKTHKTSIDELNVKVHDIGSPTNQRATK